MNEVFRQLEETMERSKHKLEELELAYHSATPEQIEELKRRMIANSGLFLIHEG